MVRWNVIDTTNNEVLGHFFNEDRAYKFIRKYEYECMYQDIPCYPKLQVVKEFLREGEEDYGKKK